MVQNVLHLIYKEIRGLHKAAYILAVFTFGSQLLALVRDRMLAHSFGAGTELDLYYSAFRIPDVLYVIFASTLSVYVLVPFITKKIEEEGNGGAQHLLSQLFSLFMFVYSTIAVVAMCNTEMLVTHLFPGFVDQMDVLVPLIRILLLQPLILGISSLFGIITQMEHRFVLFAMSPLLYNVGIIIGLVFFYPYFGLNGLVYGVVLGALGHLLIQLPIVLKSPIVPRFTMSYRRADIVLVFRSSLIRAFTLSLHQLVLLGFISFASLMAMGSVSVFQLAYNLQSVPLAIIGVSYSVAAFPLLAQLYAERKYALFGENITNALRHIIFWSVPFIALIIVVRAQFVRVVLGSGAFDWNDTRLTAAVLALFTLSLLSQAIHLLVVRALYAVENTKTPFFVTLFSSMCALVFAYCFYILFTHSGVSNTFMEQVMRLEGVSGIEVLALPLGYSCALIVHSAVLLIVSKKHLHFDLRAVLVSLMQTGIAALFSGYIAYIVLNYFVALFEVDTLVAVLTQGALASVGGMMVYFGLLRVAGNREVGEVFATLHKRFTKSDLMVPQDEDTLAV